MTTATTQAPPAPPAHTEVPSWRLLATLGFGGALAGLLIVVSYMWTLPRITAHRASVLSFLYRKQGKPEEQVA